MPEINMTEIEALKFWRSRTGLAQRDAAKIHEISVEVLIAIEKGDVSISQDRIDAMIKAYRAEWRKFASNV